jgi:hypothetical protein
VKGLGLDSLTFESSLLALPQKSPKESILRFTIPGIGPALHLSERLSVTRDSIETKRSANLALLSIKCLNTVPSRDAPIPEGSSSQKTNSCG